MKTLIKLRFKIFALLFAAAIISSCTSKSNDTCASGSFDPICNQTETVDPSILTIKYQESKFFDENTSEWSTVKASDLEEPILYKDVPLYPPVATTTVADAMNKITKTENGDAAVKNDIFYIKIEAKEGVTYLCSYKKFKSGASVAATACSFQKIGGYAYLPLINKSFNDKIYESSDKLGDIFTNEVSVIAQYSTTRSTAKVIKFNTIVSASNTSYTVGLSESMSDFSLDKRWDKYHKKSGSEYVANENLDLFKLADKKSSVSSPNSDLRVIFKEEPELSIEQEVFMEIPIDVSQYTSAKKIVPSRGYHFNQHTVTLNSKLDFNYKVTMGGNSLSKNALEWKRESFPASTPLDIRFVADLTQNSNYTNPNATPLLQPLKPSCYLERGLAFIPTKEDLEVSSKAAIGQYHAICQIDQKKSVTVTDPQSSSNTVTLKDTWMKSFDYIPERSFKNEIGSMYGIKKVTFKIKACFKVQTRSDNDNSEIGWNSLTAGGSNCGDSSAGSDWIYVSYSKSYNLLSDLEKYSDDPILKSVLDKLRVSYPTPDAGMKFNGEVLNGDSVRHLY